MQQSGNQVGPMPANGSSSNADPCLEHAADGPRDFRYREKSILIVDVHQVQI